MIISVHLCTCASKVCCKSILLCNVCVHFVYECDLEKQWVYMYVSGCFYALTCVGV